MKNKLQKQLIVTGLLVSAMAVSFPANGITENVFFISAFGITLGKYNFKKDAVFTTIYHGRNDALSVP